MRGFVVGVVGVALGLGCAGLGSDVAPVEEPVEAPVEEPAAEAPSSRLDAVDLSGDRDPDCTASDFTEAKPLLAAEQSQGGAPTVVQTANGIAETVFLDNGIELRVLRSGCAHYGEVWEVAGAPQGRPVQVMRKVAKHVDLAEEGSSSFLGALMEAPADSDGELVCCEICTCSVSWEGEVLKGVLDWAL